MSIKLIKGFITRERWILGKTPIEMERLLGFGPRRMRMGAKVYALQIIPENRQFELAGHTHWSGGKPKGREAPNLRAKEYAEIDKRWMPGPEDRAKTLVRNTWRLIGPERLVKVVPNTAGLEYPPGEGAEQWKVLTPVLAVLVKELGPREPYAPYAP